MCYIYDFRCGHSDIDQTSCANPNKVTNPCKPISTGLKLPSECSRCREAFLRSVAKRSSVMTREATRAALDFSTAPPLLFAWPDKPARKQTKPSRRGPLRSDHLAGIPESPTIVKEDRGWSAGFGKPLPCLPTAADTVRDFSPRAPKSAQSFPQRHPPPRGVSTIQQPVSLPPSLAIARPQNKASLPPAPTVPASHHTASLPPRQVTTIPQQITQARSSGPVLLPPSSAARVRPSIERNNHQLRSSRRSSQLRDAYQGTDNPQALASPHNPISRKPLPSYPAWTTLPSQVEERTKEAGVVWQKTQTAWDQRQASHTPNQELFLTTPVKEIQTHLDRGQFPSCLQPADQSQAHDLSRLSTIFNLFSETGGESSIECEIRKPATITPRTYTTYSGVPAAKNASEIPLQSYAAHAARRAAAVEFEGCKATATPTTYTSYNPSSTLKGISQSETATSNRDGSLASEKSLSELSAIFNMTSSSRSYQDQPIEFVSANSNSDPYSAYAPTTTLNQAKSLSELSAIFDMETCEAQIERETYSRLTTATSTQRIKVSDGTYVCYNPLTATFAAEAVSGLPETTAKTSMLPHELPNFKRYSAMKLNGAALEGVFGNWA
ncbi:hypothetical protein VTL71DRAFT_2512 [Oculimacula yallundae]|uniref:Uncharacterized protein n=1 Tax=Oculimacula yallundae TaxID=86028 RepID=A0ABR4CAF4_9HELO